MNRIDALFAASRENGRKVFIPFLTAGDPSIEATAELIQAVYARSKELGVPILFELGFPYSDPVADGAAIQASYSRALDKGLRSADIFSMIERIRSTVAAPLVAMISYSLVYRAGLAAWFDKAVRVGLDGAIIPDLPLEETQEASQLAADRKFMLIQLIAPTTPPERVDLILANSTGFVYSVAVTGITGERAELPQDLPQRLAELRTRTTLPICVGFGVSRPEHVAALRLLADGVIVGSAIVRRLERITDSSSVREFIDFVSEMMKPLAADTRPASKYANPEINNGCG